MPRPTIRPCRSARVLICPPPVVTMPPAVRRARSRRACTGFGGIVAGEPPALCTVWDNSPHAGPTSPLGADVHERGGPRRRHAGHRARRGEHLGGDPRSPGASLAPRAGGRPAL